MGHPPPLLGGSSPSLHDRYTHPYSPEQPLRFPQERSVCVLPNAKLTPGSVGLLLSSTSGIRPSHALLGSTGALPFSFLFASQFFSPHLDHGQGLLLHLGYLKDRH